MIEKLLVSDTTKLMEKALDAASMRNSVIADNLANVDTPGFKRSEVKFEDELARALNKSGGITGRRTHEKHLPIGVQPATEVAPRLEVQHDTSMRNDGNNVDIDREMAALAKNTILYNALVQQISGEFQKLKSVISGR
ncbi:MAG: flagellar basal body rod protein FlgB [Bacillota bacterium]